MAKILSFSPKFAARGKTTPSQKRGFLRLKSKHAEEAQSVRTPRKDERQNNRRMSLRAIESFYF